MTEIYVDYEKLAELCQIDGLKSNRNPQTTDEAHKQFMREYAKAFGKRSRVKNVPAFMKRTEPEPRISVVSVMSSSRTNMATGDKTSPEKARARRPHDVDDEETFTHDIRDYMAQLHKHRKSEDAEVVKKERLKSLRKLLRKLPFERSTEENETLFTLLKEFPDVSEQMPDNVLREMALAVQMDVWKESHITVFGNLALYMVLRGSVCPVGKTHLRKVGEKQNTRIASPTPEDEEEMEGKLLHPGECFGTLVRVPDRAMNSRILSVVTAEPNCELLKITTSDYSRITEQIESRDRTEKINLLQSSGNYKYWTRQPLQKVAKLFDWVTFPENTVIVTEGCRAKFIGFIKSGECHVLRKVTAVHELKNGKKEKQLKQVVMGKLSATESFGEDSVLGDVPITFSIVTSAECVMAVIDPLRLNELDETTKQLLHQSSSNAFADLKKDEIHDEFIKQELEREWNEFKHGVVMEVINDRAVRPGQGKWAK